jgi:hypothetical protein
MRLDALQRIAQLTGGTCLTARDLPKLATLVDTPTAHHHGALGTPAVGQRPGGRPAGRPAGHGVDFAQKTRFDLMSDNPSQTMNQCLRAVWRRAQRKHALGGLLAFARWFVPLFALFVVIDRFAYLPGWLRALAALALLVAALRQAWRHGWSRLRGFDATRTARQVERAHGGMDSLLVTAVQFERSGATPAPRRQCGS